MYGFCNLSMMHAHNEYQYLACDKTIAPHLTTWVSSIAMSSYKPSSPVVEGLNFIVASTYLHVCLEC